jgi:SAM-dependent methyltransferase
VRPLLFAAFYGSSAALRRVADALAHAAAGLLRIRDVRGAIVREWEGQATDQPVTFPEWGLMEWESVLYLRFLEPGDRVLLVGCGTGRDLIALLQRGYRAEGLDLSAAIIAAARRNLEVRGLTAPLHVAAFEEAALATRYDAIAFSWLSYGYIPTREARVGALKKARGLLAPSGRVLLSYAPERRPEHRRALASTRLLARLSGSDWRPEDGDQLSVSRHGLVHFEHRFPPGTLEAEVRDAGLSPLFHDASEGLAVVALAAGDLRP